MSSPIMSLLLIEKSMILFNIQLVYRLKNGDVRVRFLSKASVAINRRMHTSDFYKIAISLKALTRKRKQNRRFFLNDGAGWLPDATEVTRGVVDVFIFRRQGWCLARVWNNKRQMA